jgi:hypothetical protein
MKFQKFFYYCGIFMPFWIRIRNHDLNKGTLTVPRTPGHQSGQKRFKNRKPRCLPSFKSLLSPCVLFTVLFCGSGMFLSDPGTEFFHPGSRVKNIPDPGSGFASKNLSILNPKIFFLNSWIRILIFYPSRISGSKRHRILAPLRIRNTAFIPLP